MSDDKKPVETELKLLLPAPEAEAAIVEIMRSQGYKIKEIKPVVNVDVYLDTFDWSLMKKKLALRYRTVDGAAMYTLKGMAPMEKGLAQRMEIETPVKGSVDIPAEIPVKEIRNIVDGVIHPRKLLEHIQIRTERRRHRVVSPEGAKMELAFDRTSFSMRGLHKPRRAKRFHEMEAELLEGRPEALRSLAAVLTGSYGYPPSEGSKFEVALERLGIAVPSRKTPERYLVRPHDRLDLAVRKILAYQFQRFREHLPGLREDIDTEFVHQARVATRRMRSALQLFRGAVAQNTGALLEAELKWLGGMLGEVRDLDVFLLNLPGFREQIERFPVKEKDTFESWIRERRAPPFYALLESISSSRYAGFERRLQRLLESPLPVRPRSSQAVKKISEVAPPLIGERFAAVLKQGGRVLAKPKLRQFHRLRIQMKRLRYACEFVAPAYEGALDSFIERTVELQDCLGEIQDTVFTMGLLDFIFKDWREKLVGPDIVFILGEMYQLQHAIRRDRQARFGKIWERFNSPETVKELHEALGIAPASPPATGIMA